MIPPAPNITTALVLDEVGQQVPMRLVGAYYTVDQMRAYGEACRQEERERCAKLCELLSIDTRDDHWDAITADQCAYAIRSCTP